MKFVATAGDRAQTVEISGGRGQYRVTIGEQVWEVDARRTSPGIYSLLVGGVSYVADVTEQEDVAIVEVAGEIYAVKVEEATRHVIRTRGGVAAAPGPRTLVAPLPGRITHVAVTPGDRVRVGDTLLVIEAMKMENEFKAAAAGTISEVRVQAGQPVNAGDVLLVIA
jgi:oxaloacetate decarboxylase alpha subunit